MRFFGRRGFYLKNTEALEQMASIDTWVFDKTGTLTENQSGAGVWQGAAPSPAHSQAIAALAQLSTHPLSRALAGSLAPQGPELVNGFAEFPGKGVQGIVAGRTVRLGSAHFVGTEATQAASGGVWARVQDGDTISLYHWLPLPSLRPGVDELLSQLAATGQRTLLVSGDQPDAQSALQPLFPNPGQMHFRQSPADKVSRLDALKQGGHRVAMVGDGLNDAAALRQAHLGVAVMEGTAQFAPAADALIRAEELPRLAHYQRVTQKGIRIVKICFAVSVVYNLIGTTFAVQGLLQPVVAAVLMPFSSIGIILLSTALTVVMAKRQGVAAAPPL
jgi:Cu+-exporting ATPase